MVLFHLKVQKVNMQVTKNKGGGEDTQCCHSRSACLEMLTLSTFYS